MEALIAYNDGEEWLEELKRYLFVNYNYLRAYFNEYLPNFPVMSLERYLFGMGGLFCPETVFRGNSKSIIGERKTQGERGDLYGGDAGEGFIRINIVCPRQRLMDGLERLSR